MPAKAGQERTLHLDVAGRLHIELGDKLNTEGALQDDYYWHLQVDDAFDIRCRAEYPRCCSSSALALSADLRLRVACSQH